MSKPTPEIDRAKLRLVINGCLQAGPDTWLPSFDCLDVNDDTTVLELKRWMLDRRNHDYHATLILVVDPSPTP